MSTYGNRQKVYRVTGGAVFVSAVIILHVIVNYLHIYNVAALLATNLVLGTLLVYVFRRSARGVLSLYIYGMMIPISTSIPFQVGWTKIAMIVGLSLLGVIVYIGMSWLEDDYALCGIAGILGVVINGVILYAI